jgi:TPR repeat protein
LFNVATALVFYNLDAEAGFCQYKQLTKEGQVDSMVACGVVLMEGMGVPPQEEKDIEWLKKAVAFDSAQGCYELAAVLYTGLDGVLEEDAKAAFELFKKAAKQDHTAALYMMADCLVEGEGTEISVAQAVPLFYRAAECGHRYARQRIRELLAKQEYQS